MVSAGNTPSSDEDIRQQLSKFETDFFESVNNESDNGLESFATAWASFSETIYSISSKLTQDTLDLVYSFATVVESLSSGVVDALSHPATTELNQVLEESLVAVSTEDEKSDASPAYIAPAVQWLYQNLHNPYPSPQVRESIATKSKSPRKDVDNWFVDARRRIGWNDVRKRFFDNKRAKIVEAAQQFFDDNDAGLSAELQFAFAQVTSNARTLYQKVSESSLAVTLDSAVKDMTPELKRQLQSEKRKKLQGEQAAAAYPSPERSPLSLQTHLSPSVSAPSLPERTSPTGKRRLSPTIDSDDERAERSKKRPRLDAPATTPPPSKRVSNSLPSPALSECAALNEGLATVEDTPSTSAPVEVSKKRKRRLSESDGTPCRKRPQNADNRPRPVAVSDPLPLPTSDPELNAWLASFMDSPSASFSSVIPPPVSIVETQEVTAPLEIEISNLPFEPLSDPSSSFTFPSIDLSNIGGVNLDAGPSEWFSDPALNSMQPSTSTLKQTFPDFDFDFDSHLITPTCQPALAEVQGNPIDHSTFLSTNTTQSFWGTENAYPPPVTFDFPTSQPCPSPTALRAAPQAQPVVPSLSPSEKEAKRRELAEVHAKYVALCAELAASA
ncbi:homeodomain type 1 mating protein a1-1 [Coprinopsis cinerea okayama7|uniref:Homeodomain type 1 mating protein a1-1 n=1 Tax=Coprinopsis cinerea (strain Okayama-7 / 130 / ATCC MYA-4618 / FGSC 9003) TaxID=240176 RepID=A8N2T2_COPC7|nr:homeodomain type 1 mating protein a1-1 [Coprinopsis cinerea okayama7\|eukprot:XP_001829154.1 homeodomain type 1 mating protein a1-1 [Coprinopsis cinerea okayama7\